MRIDPNLAARGTGPGTPKPATTAISSARTPSTPTARSTTLRSDRTLHELNMCMFQGFRSDWCPFTSCGIAWYVLRRCSFSSFAGLATTKPDTIASPAPRTSAAASTTPPGSRTSNPPKPDPAPPAPSATKASMTRTASVESRAKAKA